MQQTYVHQFIAAFVLGGFALLGTTLMALYAIYQFLFTDQAITAEGVRRALGMYGSPNNLALLLDRAAPILIAMVAIPRLASAGESGLPDGHMRRRRMLYALALVPILAALVLTFSKGSLFPVHIHIHDLLVIGKKRSGNLFPGPCDGAANPDHDDHPDGNSPPAL